MEKEDVFELEARKLHKFVNVDYVLPEKFEPFFEVMFETLSISEVSKTDDSYSRNLPSKDKSWVFGSRSSSDDNLVKVRKNRTKSSQKAR